MRVYGGFAAAALFVACGEPAPAGKGTRTELTPAQGSAVASSSATAASSSSALPAPSVSAAQRAEVGPSQVPSGSASAPADSAPAESRCPPDMVYVAGQYCPNVRQHCLEHAREWKHESKRLQGLAESGAKGHTTASEVCDRYEAPSECLSEERRPMAFCVDRYEFPNHEGEIPVNLVDWSEAKRSCEAVGKRLCTETEFNFACEGEAMLPYSYGFERAPEKCHLDKPYRRREKKLKRQANCLADARCKAELERLDQREPSGTRAECRSPFGVYDLNGNVNEWVDLPGRTTPNRSGLKGGWWGPVRSRCRPTVTFHKEGDYGYEVGFRCCRDSTKP